MLGWLERTGIGQLQKKGQCPWEGGGRDKAVCRCARRGDDPLFLSQIHILIFKAMIIYRMNIISSCVDKARIWPPGAGHADEA